MAFWFARRLPEDKMSSDNYINNRDESIEEAIEKMVKNLDKIVIGLIIIALPFLFSFFFIKF